MIDWKWLRYRAYRDKVEHVERLKQEDKRKRELREAANLFGYRPVQPLEEPKPALLTHEAIMRLYADTWPVKGMKVASGDIDALRGLSLKEASRPAVELMGCTCFSHIRTGDEPVLFDGTKRDRPWEIDRKLADAKRADLWGPKHPFWHAGLIDG